MAYVYRYTDLSDNVIKYVGIVWSNDRTLKQRVREHLSETWCKDKEWKIECIEENICTRTDAEYFESHYISLYKTYKWHNRSKNNWGISNFLPDRENDWKVYDILKCDKSEIETSYIKNSLLQYKDNIIRILDVGKNTVLIVDCIHKSMPKWVRQSEIESYDDCTQEELILATNKIIYNYDSLDEEDKRFVHEHFALIAGILPFIGDEKKRCYMTTVASRERKFSKQTIRNYLWLYLVYQDISVLAPKQKQQNKPLTVDEKNMLFALDKYYTNNINSLQTVYDIMLKEKYCDASGMLLNKYPSIYQFRYFYKKQLEISQKNKSRVLRSKKI